jgi:hypothetical protein
LLTGNTKVDEENLDVATYRDGNGNPEEQDPDKCFKNSAWCYYDNDSETAHPASYTTGMQ